MTAPQTSSRVPDSVRLALASDALAIAALQRRAWRQALSAELADVLHAAVTEAEMATTWTHAIQRPPDARCRVLVGVVAAPSAPTARLSGMATTQPATDADADPRDGEIGEFVVDPAAQGAGHGARLLHACADTLRADGFDRARIWVAADNDPLRQFLTAAGWAPDGAWREIGIDDDDGVRIKQVRLHTDLVPA